jgi:hypothetical protein
VSTHEVPFSDASVTLQAVGGVEPVVRVRVPCATDFEEESTVYVHVVAHKPYWFCLP